MKWLRKIFYKRKHKVKSVEFSDGSTAFGLITKINEACDEMGLISCRVGVLAVRAGNKGFVVDLISRKEVEIPIWERR